MAPQGLPVKKKKSSNSLKAESSSSSSSGDMERPSVTKRPTVSFTDEIPSREAEVHGVGNSRRSNISVNSSLNNIPARIPRDFNNRKTLSESYVGTEAAETTQREPIIHFQQPPQDYMNNNLLTTRNASKMTLGKIPHVLSVASSESSLAGPNARTTQVDQEQAEKRLSSAKKRRRNMRIRIGIFRFLTLVGTAGVVALGLYGIYSSAAYRSLKVEEQRCAETKFYSFFRGISDTPEWASKYRLFKWLSISALGIGIVALIIYVCSIHNKCYHSTWGWDAIMQLTILCLCVTTSVLLITAVHKAISAADTEFTLLCEYYPRDTEKQQGLPDFDYEAALNEEVEVSGDADGDEKDTDATGRSGPSGEGKADEPNIEIVKRLVRYDYILAGGVLAAVNGVLLLILVILICTGHPSKDDEAEIAAGPPAMLVFQRPPRVHVLQRSVTPPQPQDGIPTTRGGLAYAAHKTYVTPARRYSIYIPSSASDASTSN